MKDVLSFGNAIILSLILVLPAFGENIVVSTPSLSEVNLPPLVVTAPALREEQVRQLKQVRAAGGITAVGGLGLMATVIFIGTGPFGWAAALVFVGGMTAYLSHRRLKGKNDFTPSKIETIEVKPSTASVTSKSQ